MNDYFKIKARRPDVGFGERGIDLWILLEEDGRFTHFAKPPKMQPATEGEYMRPAATISPTAAQVLMDDLWSCGIRPSEGLPTAGQLEAVKYHLEDMRSLALGKVKK